MTRNKPLRKVLIMVVKYKNYPKMIIYSKSYDLFKSWTEPLISKLSQKNFN